MEELTGTIFRDALDPKLRKKAIDEISELSRGLGEHSQDL
jgi:hypothetical protein